MKCIALRFSENFSPESGTISEHQKLIDKNGYVYYGKMGNNVSDKNISLILSQVNPRVLLIHSGGTKRYWAYIDKIIKVQPSFDEFPKYYHDMADKFKTWFRVIRFEEAQKNIMSQCKVASSGVALGEVSKHSMSPYFVIDWEDEEDEI